MKRLLLVAGLHFALAGLWAQTAVTKVVVTASFPLASFWVDGIEYRGQAVFNWLEGTQHFIRFQTDPRDGYQYHLGETVRYGLIGWTDDSDVVDLPGDFSQVVTATPSLTKISIELTVEYKINLVFWDPPLGPGEEMPPAECSPEYNQGPGVIVIGESCFWRNTTVWLEAGAYPIQVFPYPGWSLYQWGYGDTTASSFLLRTFTVVSPNTLYFYFRQARRIRLLTDPPKMQILMDRVPMVAPHGYPCDPWEQVPSDYPPGAPRLCFGEAWWGIGTTHVIGAPSPQEDISGNPWLFDSFDNGMGNHSVIEVTNSRPSETITAKFVRGAAIGFISDPPGLKLEINGRSNWLAYNFAARPGETFHVSAPPEQTGADGRKYVFSSWSNGGEATQDVVVPADAVENGLRMTAHYRQQARAVIYSEPFGVPVEVNGAPCETPCTIDREPGAEVSIVAPESFIINHSHKRDFAGWSDGGPRQRTLTLDAGAPLQLTARYDKLYLLDLRTEPAGGADFTLEPVPSTPDGYYPEGVDVRVTAEVRDGFKFRRWEGDLQGTYRSGWVKMNAARSVVAMLDEVPFIPPAGIRNAAGETPDNVVAPNSIISIYGGKLAPHLEVGPPSPLAQTLAGVTVRVEDRILGLMFVSPAQINAVLHPDIWEGPHKLVVSRPDQPDVEGEFHVARNAPGIFTRTFNEMQYVMASHEDGTPVTPDSPARRGELVTVFGTGFGPYQAVLPYGFAIPKSPEFKLADQVEAFANDLYLVPEWTGAAPGFVGTDIAKIRISDDLPAASAMEFKVRINGRLSNSALLPIE